MIEFDQDLTQESNLTTIDIIERIKTRFRHEDVYTKRILSVKCHER